MPIDIIPPGSVVLAHQTATVRVDIILSVPQKSSGSCDAEFRPIRSIGVGCGFKDCASVGTSTSTAYALGYDPSPTSSGSCRSYQYGNASTSGGSGSISETITMGAGRIPINLSSTPLCNSLGACGSTATCGSVPSSSGLCKASPGEDVTDCTITGTV